MTGLVAFLTARLDGDEAAALAACRDERARSWTSFDIGGYPVIGAGVTDGWGICIVCPPAPSEAQVRHIARHDPARVLRDVAARRARIAVLHEAVSEMDRQLADDDAKKIDQGVAIGRYQMALAAVKHDAAIYGDHPDYSEKMKP